MPVHSLSQSSFFDPRFVCPECLEPGTLPWLLGTHRMSVFPTWLLAGWRGEGRTGRKAWPSRVLLTLALLRWSETGMSRRAAVRRAKTDATWRAAMGLEFGAPTPSRRTMADFERWLMERHAEVDAPRVQVLLGRLVRLCSDEGLASSPDWVLDSTPMWCFGAALDTVRLIGDGTGILVRAWARAVGRPWTRVARELGVPWVVAPSTKGWFGADWRDRTARDQVVTRLARGALRVVEVVRDGLSAVKHFRVARLRRHCHVLLRVIEDDLDETEDGGFVVARRVASDRIVSFTDITLVSPAVRSRYGSISTGSSATRPMAAARTESSSPGWTSMSWHHRSPCLLALTGWSRRTSSSTSSSTRPCARQGRWPLRPA